MRVNNKKMVEVFKTNVVDREQAGILLDLIHCSFMNYEANFDLQDCDRILRVKCPSAEIDSGRIMDLVRESGFTAEILTETIRV